MLFLGHFLNSVELLLQGDRPLRQDSSLFWLFDLIYDVVFLFSDLLEQKLLAGCSHMILIWIFQLISRRVISLDGLSFDRGHDLDLEGRRDQTCLRPLRLDQTLLLFLSETVPARVLHVVEDVIICILEQHQSFEPVHLLSRSGFRCRRQWRLVALDQQR